MSYYFSNDPWLCEPQETDDAPNETEEPKIRPLWPGLRCGNLTVHGAPSYPGFSEWNVVGRERKLPRNMKDTSVPRYVYRTDWRREVEEPPPLSPMPAIAKKRVRSYTRRDHHSAYRPIAPRPPKTTCQPNGTPQSPIGCEVSAPHRDVLPDDLGATD